MERLQEVLDFNKKFVENKEYEAFTTSKFPDKNIVILACMDTRLVELLPQAMNFKNGDIKIVKNAGALVSHPFGSIMRSLLVGVYELQAEEIWVVGHHDCGSCAVQPDQVLEKMRKEVSDEVVDTLEHAGIDLKNWLQGAEDVTEGVRLSVDRIRNHPLLPKYATVHGLVINPENGELEQVTD
ncbi:beta-class carbonic anhydrase [Pseudalkalibacillus caeni]|uniref:carbonic anhydrase n=1 Tax=Exobacillus caeni TaxID=2574798 RepID=A0A5R9F7W6_9BACL|nr:carbonic anhydrase [Pseudalkalibacillus caeni]TLS36604.1 carbonic anhydrase [Pseudalkalibacillus caeni]